MEGSGGIADEIKRILEVAKKGKRKVFFEPDPIKVVTGVIRRIRADKKKKKKLHLEYK